MNNYDSLSINEKINLKDILRQWATYTVQHFGQELDKKVYGLRTNKSGVQRSSLSGYRFGSGKSRTNQLRRTWYQNIAEGAGVDRVMIQFLLYGRFLDMGVGRGTTHTRRVVDRQLKQGRSTRIKKAWYSKRKSYEIHQLNELLAQRNISLAFNTVETALNISVHLDL
ncbi:hypothetical protein [Spirosoma oryzicola]|uniref:hypothetical protein n=1 Tax=Spirosoma oryzicola TaxID=2898794 RepID=UPI001E5E301D|nr:hypothetical protein [Spirosoma oryzicola]UHG93422.1 hypothetical protein LQ777_11070 [Spirosoma oryzicola]